MPSRPPEERCTRTSRRELVKAFRGPEPHAPGEDRDAIDNRRRFLYAELRSVFYHEKHERHEEGEINERPRVRGDAH